jgi:hypothetical protein
MQVSQAPGGKRNIWVTCTAHELSTVTTRPSILAEWRSVGVLDAVHEYACTVIARDALSGLRLHSLAEKPGEKWSLLRPSFGSTAIVCIPQNTIEIVRHRSDNTITHASIHSAGTS